MKPEEDSASLYNQFEHFQSSGQFERARDVAGQLLTREPDSPWLHLRMGFVLMPLEDHIGSEKHFKKSIELDPDNADAFKGLGYLYWAMGRAGVADDYARKAVALDPDDEDCWILMAYLCLHFNDPKQALYCVERAENISPEDLRLTEIKTKARAIFRGKEQLSAKEQITSYESILAKDAENESAHVNIGLVYFNELKNYEKAEEHFRAALCIDPEDKEDQNLLIKALRKRDPVLKLLWAPLTPALWIFKYFEWSWEKKWPLLFLLLTGKVLFIAVVAICLFFFLLFWPLTKVYEWLTIVEIHKKMGRISLHQGRMAWLHRLSLPTRYLIFGTTFIAFWTLAITAFTSEAMREPIVNIIAFLITAGVTITAFYGWYSSIRDTRRARARSKKNEALYEKHDTNSSS